MVNDEKLKQVEDYLGKQSIEQFLNNITEKAERNYFCPFHVEKIPSLSVNEEKGICKCFSCGRSGGLAKLIFYLKEVDEPGIHYYDAIEAYLKENPEVCAELGFYSIQDDFYREQRIDRSYTETVLSKVVRHPSVELVDNFQLLTGRESIDEIMRKVYLRQKRVSVSTNDK